MKQLRKVLAVLLALALVVPGYGLLAFADDPVRVVVENEYGSTSNEVNPRGNDDAKVNKQVTKSPGNPGEYFIDLNIEGKTSTRKEPLDIVLVLDNSGSMGQNNRRQAANAAIRSFLEGLEDTDNDLIRVALVTYATEVINAKSYFTLTNDFDLIRDVLPQNVPSGQAQYTNTQAGILRGSEILSASGVAEKQVIITLTDGVPTVSNDPDGVRRGPGNFWYQQPYHNPAGGGRSHGMNTIASMSSIPSGIDMYSVGIQIAHDSSAAGATMAEALEVMHGITKAPGKYYPADDVDELVEILLEIATSVLKSIQNGSVTDPMGEMAILPTPFTAATNANLTNGSYFLSASDPALLNGVTVSLTDETININGLNLGAGESVNLRYKIQIDTEHPDFKTGEFYRTNGATTLIPIPDGLPLLFPEPEFSAKGIDVNGTKVWNDFGLEQYRPDTVTVRLMRDINSVPTEVAVGEAAPDLEGNWTYSFPDQIRFDNQGNLIDYYIDEDPVPGYESDFDPATGTLTNTLIAQPDINLEKEADRDNLVAGEYIGYTFTATNTGNVPLSKVTISDTLPNISAITYVSINGNPVLDPDNITLRPGDVLAATATYLITQADVDSGSVTNHATVVGTDPNDETVEDDDSTTVPQDSDAKIELVKVSDISVVTVAGQEITYTFTVTNIGNVTLTNVTLNDPKLGGPISLNKTTLAPQEQATGTATYTVTQADIDAGSIYNIATVVGTDPSDETVTDDDDNTVTVDQNPQISLLKTANRDNLVAGEYIDYTLTATNTGNTTLTKVTISDTLPNISAITYVSINGNPVLDPDNITLRPGDVLAATATYLITQADVDSGSVTNHATVVGTDPNDETVEDDDSTTVSQDSDAKIKVVKEASTPVVTRAGQEITYTFTVTNTGNTTLTNVTLNDPMLGGPISLNKTTLTPQEQATGTATYTVTQADIDAGSIYNIATVEGTGPNGEKPTDDDDNTVTAEQTPAIELVKVSDISVVSAAGQEITYTFTVTNTGNTTLTNVTLNDPMLGGPISLNKTTLTPQEQATGTATYTVTQADIDAGSIYNIATVVGTDPGDETVTDDDDNTVTAAQASAIELDKNADTTLVTVAGQEITYTFTVTNTGNTTLTNVTLNDPKLGGPISLNKTTLTPQEQATGTATYTVTQADVDDGGVYNLATVVGTDPSNETVTDDDDVTVPAEGTPAIELDKNADTTLVTVAGQEITYTFTVTNIGNVTLTNVTLNDPMLGGPISLNKTTLTPQEQATGTATYTVTQADVDAGNIYNIATVVGTDPNDETVTDDDDNTVPVAQASAIELEKVSDISVVSAPGQEITYTFTVTNIGNVTLTNVTLNDPMLGGPISLNKTTLAPQEQATGTATYTVTQADIDAGVIENIATTEGTGPNGEKPTDTDEETVVAEQAPSIELVKKAGSDSVTHAGETITYTFTVTNTGNVTLTDVALTDPMLGGPISLDKTTLAPQEQATGTATYTVTQADIDAGVIENTATVKGTDPKGTEIADDDEENVPAKRSPGIKIEKTSDKSTVGKVGDKIVYTFTVTNTGNVTLTDIVVTDPMLGGVIPLNKTTLSPNESMTVSVTYTVTQADIDKTEIVNHVTVEGTPPGYDPDDPDSPQKPKGEDDNRVNVDPVKTPAKTKLPKTDDMAPVFPLMVISAVGILLVIVASRRMRKAKDSKDNS